MAQYFWTAKGGSPAAWNTGGNWTKSDGTTGTVPGAGDDAYIVMVPGLTLAPINFYDASGGGTLNSLNYAANCNIGTTDTTSGNVFGYLKLPVTTINISTPDGSGATGGGRIKINNSLGSANTCN